MISIGAHVASPGSTLDNFASVEVLQNMLTDGRSIIDDVADNLQLSFLNVVR